MESQMSHGYAVELEKRATELEKAAVKMDESAIKLEDTAVNYEESAFNLEKSATKRREPAIELRNSAIKLKESAINLKVTAIELKESAIKLKDSIAAEAATSNEVPPTFPLFSELPLELQLRIWYFVDLHHIRGVQVDIIACKQRRNPARATFKFKTITPVPKIFHINHASRQEGFKHYKTCFRDEAADGEETRSIYINPSTDTLYIRFPAWAENYNSWASSLFDMLTISENELASNYSGRHALSGVDESISPWKSVTTACAIVWVPCNGDWCLPLSCPYRDAGSCGSGWMAIVKNDEEDRTLAPAHFERIGITNAKPVGRYTTFTKTKRWETAWASLLATVEILGSDPEYGGWKKHLCQRVPVV